MQSTQRLQFLVTLLCVPLVTTGGTDAMAQACQTVHAVGNAREIVDCPAGQKFDFCIVRTSLTDRAGLLTGRLEYFEDSGQGSTYPQTPSINVYVAVSKITTDKGTLEFAEHGVFDTESLDFAGLVTVTDGSGELEGFAGTLGTVGNAKGTVLLTGTICNQ